MELLSCAELSGLLWSSFSTLAFPQRPHPHVLGIFNPLIRDPEAGVQGMCGAIPSNVWPSAARPRGLGGLWWDNGLRARAKAQVPV